MKQVFMVYKKGKGLLKNILGNCMQKKLSVEGMTCRHCVKRVAGIIEKAPGVSGVQVSLENKEALFSCDPLVTNVADIVWAINEFGFTAAEKA